MPITLSLSSSTLVAQFSGSESSRNSGGEQIFDRDLVRLVLFEVRDEDEASRSTGLLFAVDGKSTILDRDRPLLLDMARGFYECIFVRKSIKLERLQTLQVSDSSSRKPRHRMEMRLT
jgi:hypothetical protein